MIITNAYATLRLCPSRSRMASPLSGLCVEMLEQAYRLHGHDDGILGCLQLCILRRRRKHQRQRVDPLHKMLFDRQSVLPALQIQHDSPKLPQSLSKLMLSHQS